MMLVYLCVGNQKEAGEYILYQNGKNKKCQEYKAGDRYCVLCVEEKIAIASPHWIAQSEGWYIKCL